MMKFNNVARAVRPFAGKRMQMFSSLSGGETSSRVTPGNPSPGNHQKFSSLSVEYDSEPESYGLDPSVRYTSVAASSRQLCDFELIANGGFAPLDGFMNQADHENVCANFRLSDGHLWPIPITMDIDEKTKAHLEANDGKLLLTDANGVERGILHVDQIWKPNKEMES
jgi:sulfate adenylyltransferase